MKTKVDVSDWDLGNWPELFEPILEPIIRKIAQEAIEAFLTGDDLIVSMGEDGLTIDASSCGLSQDVTIPIERICGKIAPFIKGFTEMEADIGYEWAIAAGKIQERWHKMEDAELDEFVQEEYKNR
jgi:hypothetical protein